MIEHNLTIYSLNVRATDEAQKDLLRIADQKRIDIVAVQEITGNTGVPVVTNTGPALPTHPTHTEARQHSLKTTIKPSIAPKGYVLASQHSEGQRICFYVRKDLALQHWSCKVHNFTHGYAVNSNRGRSDTYTQHIQSTQDHTPRGFRVSLRPRWGTRICRRLESSSHVVGR
jgi:hypothetical protein